MSIYPDEFLEKVKDRTDIVELIGSYVRLQRKGRDYWACCPFHNEKTPSFQISSIHQFYKCYGCGKYGNVITFVRDYEKIGFGEAVEKLAKRAGLEIPQLVFDSEAKARRELAEKIYTINREAALFYRNNLFVEEGRAAREYLAVRQLDAKTVNKFGIGVSTDFSSLPKYLLSKGYDKKTLLQAGIVSQSEKSGEIYDFFGNRLVIPIINSSKKIVGFSARTLEPKPNFAKYKNTSVTPVFYKGRVLFGLNIFKEYKHGEVRAMILVEGHMDAISLYQAGIQNVVASMGTALTVDQCREIKRYADVVYVSFDGDSAGQNATLRGLDLLKNEGLDVKVVCLKDNMDPDDYVKKYGKEGYLKLLDEALPLIDYKLMKVEERFDLSNADEKIKYAKAAIVVLNTLNPMEKEIYGKIVAEKSGLKLEVILNETIDEEVKKRDNNLTLVKAEANTPMDMLRSAEKFVVSSLIYGKTFVEVDTLVQIKDYFSDKKLIEVIDHYLKSIIEKHEIPKVADVFDIVEDNAVAGELTELVNKIPTPEQEEYYRQCIGRIKSSYINQELKKLIIELNNSTDATEKEKLKEKVKNLTRLQMKKD